MTVNKQGVNKQYATHDTYTYKQKKYFGKHNKR